MSYILEEQGSGFNYAEAGQVLWNNYREMPLVLRLEENRILKSGDPVSLAGDGIAVPYDGTLPLAGFIRNSSAITSFANSFVTNTVYDAVIYLVTNEIFYLQGSSYSKVYLKPDGTLTSEEIGNIFVGLVMGNSKITNISNEYLTPIKLNFLGGV